MNTSVIAVVGIVGIIIGIVAYAVYRYKKGLKPIDEYLEEEGYLKDTDPLS